jgi:2-amino-1-hydroxyethylphosphonate dioxygenase (glycine-forming)
MTSHQSKIIKDLFNKHGDKDYIGEAITQTHHMVQAAMLAENSKCKSTVILASLLHDIGHLLDFENKENNMGNYGKKDHEHIGAIFLENLGFPESITVPIKNHVSAKRYMSIDKQYYKKLSEASKQTLKFQGGIFTEQEAIKFEQSPFFIDSVYVRYYDDNAKDKDKKMKTLEYYLKMIDKLFK